ncbi:hypothetical protein Tco_1209163 [Tanacetum coccineum]
MGASLGSLQVLIGSGLQELKSCREYYHKYRALIPEEIINQAIKDSKSYKIYLAYAPWKKKTLVTIEEEEPEPAKKDKQTKKLATKIKSFGFQIRDTLGVSVSKKKTPAKVSRSKGIELLFDAALLEEAQLKKALRRSKRETTILQEGGSSEGTDFESEVPDESKGKSTGANEGTGTIPGVPDVPKDQFESEKESWGVSGDDDSDNDDNDDESNDDGNNVEDDDDHEQVDDERTESDDEEEEKHDDEFIHTSDDYLYGDVNISLKDALPVDKEKGDVEITVASQVNVNQEGAGNQVKNDAQVRHKTKGPIPSSSISSDYAAKYLNFDNIPPVDTEVVSMLDINVQHEVPRTLPLLTIPVSVIPEHTVVNLPEIVTTTSSTTISSLLSSLFPHLQQLTPIPTPMTTEATTSTTAVFESKTLANFHQRITNLEKDVKELKTVDHSATLLSTIKSEVPNAVKEYP